MRGSAVVPPLSTAAAAAAAEAVQVEQLGDLPAGGRAAAAADPEVQQQVRGEVRDAGAGERHDVRRRPDLPAAPRREGAHEAQQVQHHGRLQRADAVAVEAEAAAQQQHDDHQRRHERRRVAVEEHGVPRGVVSLPAVWQWQWQTDNNMGWESVTFS